MCYLFLSYSCNFVKEFEDSGDPEKYFEDLVSLAKEGVEKGKVSLSSILLSCRSCFDQLSIVSNHSFF